MIPVPKVSIHDVLAREWMQDFMARPLHEHAAMRSSAGMRMKAAWRELHRSEAMRESFHTIAEGDARTGVDAGLYGTPPS